jgi:hypothetical protein
MSVRRSLILVALALFAAGCTDETGPLPPEVQQPLAQRVASSTEVHILQQSPTAPPLKAYRVSFWAYKGDASTVTVNYQPAAGEWVGQPFLRFDIPRNGLVAGADGASLKRGDSVWVTLTVDSVNFLVHFQPSGVLFSKTFPANLAIWYDNANPDLNGDEIVNGKDKQLEQQLAVWYHAAQTRWSRLSSKNDTTQRSVSTVLYHFSEYAVSW